MAAVPRRPTCKENEDPDGIPFVKRPKHWCAELDALGLTSPISPTPGRGVLFVLLP